MKRKGVMLLSFLPWELGSSYSWLVSLKRRLGRYRGKKIYERLKALCCARNCYSMSKKRRSAGGVGDPCGFYRTPETKHCTKSHALYRGSAENAEPSIEQSHLYGTRRRGNLFAVFYFDSAKGLSLMAWLRLFKAWSSCQWVVRILHVHSYDSYCVEDWKVSSHMDWSNLFGVSQFKCNGLLLLLHYR